MAPYLSVERIEKRYNDTQVLTDINLSVMKGEMICFLGPSGCGKTTLLRIIAGLETQNAGHITQDGRDISRLPRNCATTASCSSRMRCSPTSTCTTTSRTGS